ncbi:MAG: hypothetical protein QF752_17595 [Planctomycetota bacterium]|jgi:hypothetical protein|nr:hypothetical protein [Planctomycetota bacterium]
MMLSKSERRLASITGWVVGVVLFWGIYLDPTLTGIAEARNSIVKVSQNIGVERRRLVEDRKSEKLWKSLSPKLWIGRQQFEERLLSDIRSTLNVEPRFDDPSIRVSKDKSYQTMKYSLSFRRVELGSACELMALLDAESVLVGISNLSLKTGNGRVFNLTMDIETAVLPGGRRRGGVSPSDIEVSKSSIELVNRIKEKNFFSLYQQSSSVIPSKTEETPQKTVERPVRERFILVGIFYDYEDEVLKALLEESSGASRVVTEGDQFGEARIQSVRWEGIVLQKGDESLEIGLEESFDGRVIGTERVSPGQEKESLDKGSSKKSDPLPKLSADRKAEILRRMKEKRRKSRDK